MHPLLDNPVFNALSTGDQHLSRGTDLVKHFDVEVSPFAGFPEDHTNGFRELHMLLPTGRRILYATRKKISEPDGWQLQHEIEGAQFVFDVTAEIAEPALRPIPLQTKDVEQMVALAALTKPGPFDQRTIEFGHYHGIFSGEQLVSMTGQRLHVEGYSEISAVCTHPDHLGKGYAAALLQHQLKLIISQGKIPFLHVRADNERAIALYERLGFARSGVMNFYFMKRI